MTFFKLFLFQAIGAMTAPLLYLHGNRFVHNISRGTRGPGMYGLYVRTLVAVPIGMIAGSYAYERSIGSRDAR
jgi:hypothetical protein